MFANALGQERDAPLLERRSELVEIRSVAPKACRVSRVALDLAHEVLDFGRDLPTGAADEGADFVRIEQPPARTRAPLAIADVDLARPVPLLLVINTHRLSRAAGPFLRPFYDIPRLRLTAIRLFGTGFDLRRYKTPQNPKKDLYLPVRAETPINKDVFHGGRPSLHWAFGPYGALNSVYVALRNRSLSNF